MHTKNTKAVILAIGIGTFMSSFDASVVNLAMPLIKAHFNVSLAMVEWIITSYLLVISTLLLTFGRLADLYGHKKIYSTGLVIFTAGSLLCGFSFNIVMLIICRILQATGAGMLYSTGPAIITDAVPPENRGKALSTTAIAVALGLCTGPVAGGALSSLFGWQSIFYINIPVGLLALFMVERTIETDGKTTKTPFDITGSILIFAALLFILLPLDLSSDHPLPPYLFIGALCIGAALIAGFILFELKTRFPLLKISLFKNRVFAASNIAALFIYMAQFIMVFLAPFYLENLRGYSALLSGFLYLPMPLATMCVAPISGTISDHFDSRYISSFGALIMAGGLYLLSLLNATTSYTYIIFSMILTGFGFGMFQTPNNSAIMGNVPPENRGTASGTLATMRNIGMVMGVAVSGALFALYKHRAITLYTPQNLSEQTLQTNSFVYALHHTFVIATGVALIAMSASFIKGKVKTERERIAEKA